MWREFVCKQKDCRDDTICLSSNVREFKRLAPLPVARGLLLQKRLQSEAAEMRSRVAALQLELDNSEKVQQDFVRLSQSLQ
ncbi:hypothetical protein F3G54_33220, partial [Pseudomonas aeruginosa]